MTDPTTPTPSAQSTARSPEQDRLNEVIAEYFAAAEAGAEPDRDEFIRRHPDFADALREFFVDRQVFERMARTLSIAPGLPPAGAGTTTGVHAAGGPQGQRVRYFGDYELVEELARGGMGVVYKARQVSLARFVALKMILSGQFASAAEVLRFRTEAESAAALDHPNIVPIYEVGEHHGQHYFAMKLIDGGSLDRWAKDHPPSQREIARVTEAVARAVHYGHQRGILHRDLKPANVLMDPGGMPFVTDFGIAKRTESGPAGASDSRLTHTAALLGTPAYMAPEQAAGKAKQVSVATDVYGLGAILYSLLAGRPPFEAESAPQTLRLVTDAEPKPPRSINPKAEPDLQTICLKCLEKDPGRRYPSAEALADDLGRWLRGEPIQARPAGRGERLLKWARRRPSVAALILVSAVSAMVLAVALGFSYVRVRTALGVQTAAAREKRDRLIQDYVTRGSEAMKESDDGAALLWFAAALREETEPDRRAVLRTRIGLSLRRMPRIHNLLTSGAALTFSDDGASLVSMPPTATTWWGAFRHLEGEKLVREHLSGTAAVDTAFVAYQPPSAPKAPAPKAPATPAEPDPASGDFDITTPVARLAVPIKAPGSVALQFWDVGAMKPLGRTAAAGGEVRYVTFSADQRRAAVWYAGEPGHSAADVVRVWDVGPGSAAGPAVVVENATAGALSWVELDGHGKRLVTMAAPARSTEFTGAVWDVETGARVFSFPIARHTQISTVVGGQAHFSSDGRRLLALWGGPGLGVARTWDLAAGKALADEQYLSRYGGEHNLAPAGGFAPDGSAWINEGKAATFRYKDTLQQHSELSPAGWLEQVGFSPDGRRAVTVSRTDAAYAVQVWDQGSRRPLTPQVVFSDEITRCIFSPDGKRLAVSARTGNTSHLTQVRDAVPINEAPLFAAPEHNFMLAFSRDGRRAALEYWPNRGRDQTYRVRLVDIAAGTHIDFDLPFLPRYADFSPDGTRLALGGSDRAPGGAALFAVLDAATGKCLVGPRAVAVPGRQTTDIANVVFTGDGAWVRIVVTDVTDADKPFGYSVALSASDGSPMPMPAAAELRGGAAASGSPAAVIVPFAFSDDGKRALVGETASPLTPTTPQPMRVWDVPGRKPLSPPIPFSPQSAGFSPDGQKLLVRGSGLGDHQEALSLLDAQTGKAVWTVHADTSATYFAFSPDQSKVATWGGDTIEIRDARDGAPPGKRIPFLRDRGLNWGWLRFSRDGTLILAAEMDGNQVGVWDARTGDTVATLPFQFFHESGARPTLTADDHLLLVRGFQPASIDLAPDQRGVEQLEPVIELLSGRRLKLEGGLTALSGEEMVARWKALRAAGVSEVGPGR